LFVHVIVVIAGSEKDFIALMILLSPQLLHSIAIKLSEGKSEAF